MVQNVKDRRKQRQVFILVFACLLGGLFFSGAVTLVSAQQGVRLLETKKSSYDKLFQKQAEFNFLIEEIFRDLHNLRSKERTSNEYKYMQKIITQKRMMLEEEIAGFEGEEQKHYTLYQQLLELIKETQGVFDAYDYQSRKREYNIDQLEKCRKKYQEITKRDNGKNKRWTLVDKCPFWIIADLCQHCYSDDTR